MAGNATPLARCVRCDDVIGVYEWLVHVADGTARRTSRAAEPEVVEAPGELYHLACYNAHVPRLDQ